MSDKDYLDNKDLCKWLRDNSSGDYRRSSLAACVIESQQNRIASLQAELKAREGISNDELTLLADWCNDNDLSFKASIDLNNILDKFRPPESE